jgi:hypothetical protein
MRQGSGRKAGTGRRRGPDTDATKSGKRAKASNSSLSPAGLPGEPKSHRPASSPARGGRAAHDRRHPSADPGAPAASPGASDQPWPERPGDPAVTGAAPSTRPKRKNPPTQQAARPAEGAPAGPPAQSPAPQNPAPRSRRSEPRLREAVQGPSDPWSWVRAHRTEVAIGLGSFVFAVGCAGAAALLRRR